MSYAPYPAYKDSGVQWLGQVPEGWDGARLSYFFSVQLGKMLQPDAKSADDVSRPYLRAANIDWAGVKLDDVKEMFFSPSDLEKYALQKGDLLISEGGDVGRASYWDSDQDIFIQNAINRVRPLDTKRVSAKFAFYWFYLLKKAGLIDIQCNSSTIAHFTAEKVKATDFVVPPFEEQTAIADFLDKKTAEIDDLIAKKEELLRLLAEQRTALITHAATKGLDPAAPMKPSGIEWLGYVPEEWQVKPLSYLIKTTKGYAFKSSDFCDDGVRVVRASDIKKKSVLKGSVFLPNSFLTSHSNVLLSEGDVIISTVGSHPSVRNSAVGQIGKVPKELANSLLNQNTVILRSDAKIITQEFLILVLTSTAYREHLDLHAHGTANQCSLSLQDILKYKTALPKIEEQKKITDIVKIDLERLNNSTEHVNLAINRLQEYRNALITNAVTGKIKVA